MFLYEADDQPYDEPKETYRVQDLNNLKVMQNYLDL